MFGTGGEHAIGIFHALGDKVVHHDTDEAGVAGEVDRGFVLGKSGGVDSGDNALASGFFVSTGAVELTGEE